MSTVTLNINGRSIKARPGASVLEAALAAGIYIPHLCHNPDLKPMGGCRLCLVEIKDIRGLPAACTTQAAKGMVVNTFSAELDQVRRDTLELLLANHPMNCLTCTKNQRCELQKVAAHMGMSERRFRYTATPKDIDDSNPFFTLDHSYCILCQRCTRTCDEVVHAGIIDIIQRGDKSRVASFVDL